MNYEIVAAKESDKEDLAELRLIAMKESLQNIGRFDPNRVKSRFLGDFSRQHTKKICVADNLAGFYVLKVKGDHLYLNHFYILPNYQGKGLGGKILDSLNNQAAEQGLVIKLGALRGSRSNAFYKKHGFIYTHEDEWDIYYASSI